MVMELPDPRAHMDLKVWSGNSFGSYRSGYDDTSKPEKNKGRKAKKAAKKRLKKKEK